MKAPIVARVIAIIVLLVGVAGCLPWIAPAAPPDAPFMSMEQLYRFVFGVFATNISSIVLYAIVGLLGLASAATFGAARIYCRVVVWICLLLAVLGAIPITSTLFGIAPLYGWDIVFHAAVLLLAAYGGYGAGSFEADELDVPV